MVALRYKRFLIRGMILLFWVLFLITFLITPVLFRVYFAKRSLTIFTWPTTLDVSYLKKFEQETGIKVYVNYYESNQELFSKLRMTKAEGYDLIMPSDYTIELLINENLLKKIDKNKLTFFDKIDPRLLHLYYDPQGEYSIPFFWGIYGLGINKNFFGSENPPATWGLIFDPALTPGNIGMTQEPREAIMLTAHYLFGSINVLKDPEKIKKIKALLFKQKSWVTAYSEARSEDLLLSNSCPVVVALSTEISKSMQRHANINFLIPQEGSFAFIDALVIPKTTEKDEMIYAFINFLYRPDVLKHHIKKYGFCSPIKQEEQKDMLSFCPTDEQFKKLDFFRNVVPEAVLNDIWIELMGW